MTPLATRTLDAKGLLPLYTGTGSVPAGHSSLSRNKENGHYLADDRLRDAVRTAIALEKPLLVTGEPGTGKTALAWSIASELGLGEPLSFFTRSDSRANDILYNFDHVLRFYEAQTNNPRAADPRNYIQLAALGSAIVSADTEHQEAAEWRKQAGGDGTAGRRVVLIDEVDKAPRDFPNDLLDEIDSMQFRIKEIPGLLFRAKYRPLIVITNNSERQLPDAFLRRCVFHYIDFPQEKELRTILLERIGANTSGRLIDGCVRHFRTLREMGERKELEKAPATAELESWLRVLLMAGVPAEQIEKSELSELPHLSAIIKTQRDLERVRRKLTASVIQR